MLPALRACWISPPGRLMTYAPSLASTSPPNPGIRIFKPSRSLDGAHLLVKPSLHLRPCAASSEGFQIEGCIEFIPQRLAPTIVLYAQQHRWDVHAICPLMK